MNKTKIKREILYKKAARKHGGVVRCHCCGQHVSKAEASLEHMIPRALGGTLRWGNVAISHTNCNSKRGAPQPLWLTAA